MKNILSVLILITALIVAMASANLITASTVSDQSTFEVPSTSSGTTPSASSGTIISASTSSTIQTSVGDLEPVAKGNFFINNWGILLSGLLAFADVVTRLTPTEKDNSILNFLVSVFNAIIPNLKKGGEAFSKEWITRI